ncbi:hypothetical protein [Spongiimicrobium sp. 3-5]|uniref:hypothetical protein n=1 Tax=Spongiimicrobium sp. 3-5 TaxID=3332596 RepID=UPI00398156C3
MKFITKVVLLAQTIAVLFSNFAEKSCKGSATKKNVKQLLAYWFILLYLLAMARPVGPLLEYIIYEDYIAEFLCINKDDIQLQCNGKCYLMQQLQEQQDNKKQNLPKIAIEEYPIGFVTIFKLQEGPQAVSKINKSSTYQNNYHYLFSDFLFHPPAGLS